MISTDTIQKLINPDFRCVIEENNTLPNYDSCFRYDAKCASKIALGGIKECLEAIKIEVLKHPDRYSFPIFIQIFDQQTGKLLWNGRVTQIIR
ncbi:hypothetical protein ACSTS3_10545 [Aquimarina muelleri]|uniref:hypothetical protein n=1 Tax=Aquimarina muelleri TaxID=279356 RepID=UPI003F689204